MRTYKYTIHFKNGIQTIVNTNGFTNAAVLGYAWAVNGGLSPEIEQIADEKGNVVSTIKVNINFEIKTVA